MLRIHIKSYLQSFLPMPPSSTNYFLQLEYYIEPMVHLCSINGVIYLKMQMIFLFW